MINPGVQTHTNNNNLIKFVQDTAKIVADSNTVNIPTNTNSNDKKNARTRVAYYNKQKERASFVAMIFGGLGLFLMILENEFIMNEVYGMVDILTFFFELTNKINKINFKNKRVLLDHML